jgi:hypothetical protein
MTCVAIGVLLQELPAFPPSALFLPKLSFPRQPEAASSSSNDRAKAAISEEGHT